MALHRSSREITGQQQQTGYNSLLQVLTVHKFSVYKCKGSYIIFVVEISLSSKLTL
jgi:hypothetical protein